MVQILLNLAGLLVFAATTAGAGPIYGTIQKDGGVAPSNTEVSVVCGSGKFSGKVRSHGRYRVNVGMEGRCTVEVNNASTDITSYGQPTRYDFILSGRDNDLTLRVK